MKWYIPITYFPLLHFFTPFKGGGVPLSYANDSGAAKTVNGEGVHGRGASHGRKFGNWVLKTAFPCELNAIRG